MAKRKEEIVEETESSNDFITKVMKLIKKDFGENIAVSGDKFLTKKLRTIPISPAINLGIGGGIPEGSWFTLSGKPKCGKTVTALHFAAKCQQEKNGGKHIYYLNVEGRLKEMNLNGITGLKTTPEWFTVIGSEEDKILSAQDYLNIAEKILLTHPECVLIIDSFSMLCHEKEITDGVGTSTRGGGAALLAQFCRQMANVVPVKRSIVVGIAQLMSNTSGYGAATMEKGGNGIQYQVDVKLRCKNTEPWEHNGKRVGQKLTWLVECSALGMPPGQEFESHIRYNHGIDEVKEVITLGIDLGIIDRSGAWYYCDFMQNHLPSLNVTEWTEEVRNKCRAQGEDKLYELIKNNPDWITYLEKNIKTTLGI